MLSFLLILFKGWIVGVVVAAPVGPVGLICIRRSLHHGWIPGLLAGLGAALADTLLGAIAVFGVVAISDFILAYQNVLKVLGGIILCGLGAKILLIDSQRVFSSSPDDLSEHSAPQKWRDFAASFTITITNPGTIFAFLAIFAGMGLTHYATELDAAAIFTAGVFIGSLSWWGGLSYGVELSKKRFSDEIYKKVDLVSGLLILGFGLFAFFSLGLERIE